MPKYEIMVIIDPKADISVAEKIANDVFGKNSFKKLDRTELAYEINKSKTAHYALINVDTEGKNIQEFTRLTNIEKSIWRIMPINLETETELKQNLRQSKKPVFTKAPYNKSAPRRDGEKRTNNKPEYKSYTKEEK